VTDFVLRQRDHRFPSPAAAQFWADWWQKGIAMPAAIAVVLVTVLIVMVVRVQLGWSILSDSLKVFVGLTLILVCWLPWGFGVFLGQVDMSKQSLGFKGFAGTLPVSDAFLARSILKAGACSLLSLAAICTLLVGIACGWVIAVEGLDTVRFVLKGNSSPVSVAVVSLLAAWIGLGTTMSLTMTGRGWIGLWALGLLGAFALLCLPLMVLLLPAAVFDAVRLMTALMFAVACVAGSIWAFVAAYKRHYVGLRTVRLSATVWLVLCSVLGWFWAAF